jgi:hypothetical protein
MSATNESPHAAVGADPDVAAAVIALGGAVLGLAGAVAVAGVVVGVVVVPEEVPARDVVDKAVAVVIHAV